MVTYDSTTKRRTVEVFIYRSDHNKTASVTFKNSYQANPAILEPPVVKTVTGKTSSDSEFKFKLKAKNESNPMPSGSSNGVKYITIRGSGTAKFGTWTYTKSGMYVYKVSEVNTGIFGYRYDTTVYMLTDVVTVDSYGGVLIQRSIDGNRVTSASKFKFVNSYSYLLGPITGDIARTTIWIILSVMAAVAIFIVIKPRRH
jgi:pilin isopeptide linkage protein